MSLDRKEIYEFEGFRLDIGERLLERRGKRVELTDRAFDVLSMLVRNAGKLVKKDQLLEEVWPGTFVEENSINKNVSMLRKSLGQGKADGKFIETVRGRGFRFVAKATKLEERDTVLDEKAPRPIPLTTGVPAPTQLHRYFEEKRGNVVTLAEWRPQEAADIVEPVRAGAEPDASADAKSRRLPYLPFIALALITVIGLWVILYLANRPQTPAATSQSIRTIAVLPFKPMLNEGRDEAFEMGMADTLISKLSASREMSVRPLSAVRRYNSVDADELAAGRALKVDAVLGGSIQRSNDKVRINVRLLRVADGMAIWSGTFDEDLTDIFSIQDAISHRVVSALNVKLNADEELQLAKRYTNSPEAYEYYLRGRSHYFRITLSELEKAAEYFQKAIEADPNYALAYAWLAEAYRTQSVPTLKLPSSLNEPAKLYAKRALELDETLPDAHIALAWIHLFYDFDWAAAEKEARRAIELAPNNSDGHRVLAHVCSITGRHEEAIAESRRARELAPLTLITSALDGQFLMYAGHLDDAEERLKKTLEMDPNFYVALNALAKVYFLKGRNDEAIETMRKAVDRSGGNNEPTGHLAFMLAKTGNRAEAMKMLVEIESKGRDGFVPMHYVAGIKLALGERDEALSALEKALQQREAGVAFLRVDHRFRELWGDARFESIVQRMSL